MAFRQSYLRVLKQLMIDQSFRSHPKRRKKATYDRRRTYIKWHSCDGPDSIMNEALCSFHHVDLDSGAISLNDNMRIIVSVELTGGRRVDEVIYKYEGREIMLPQPGFDPPGIEYLQWHRKEVFRSPGRLLLAEGNFRLAAEPKPTNY